MSHKFTDAELAAILKQIEEREAAEKKDAEYARQVQAEWQKQAPAPSARQAETRGLSSPAGERKADDEIQILQAYDSAASARESGGSRQPGARMADISERKRRVEEQQMRNKDLLEQAQQDEILARKLQEEQQRALAAREDTQNDALLAEALAASFKTPQQDTSSDALLALSLSETKPVSFEQKLRVEGRQLHQSYQDFLFAHALQNAEQGRSITPGMLLQLSRTKRNQIDPELWKKYEASLQTILASPAVIGEPESPELMDAHKYTKTLIREGIPVLVDIDNQFKLSNDKLTPDQVLKEVLDFLATLSQTPARVSLENIQKTITLVKAQPAVEAAETQANVHHVLSRVWTLAKKWGVNAMADISTCLSDNIGDQGGCMAGLIARLYAPYAKLIGLELGMAPNVQKPASKP